MPLKEVPEELKAQLIMELMAFAVTRDRIWKYWRPTTALAELIKSIFLNKPIDCSGTTYLYQELRKSPELEAKLERYIE